MRKLLALAGLGLLFAAGIATAATVVTELHVWTATATISGGGAKKTITLSGTITDEDTIPDPVTVTETVTVTGTTGTTTAPPPPAGPTIAPGQSWQGVYDSTPAGSTITVLTGVHTPGLLTGVKPMTFQGQPGNVVRQLHTNVDNLTLDGLNVDCNRAAITGACYENGGASSDTFKNGSIGNVTDDKAALVDGDSFTFDNVTFHDVYATASTVHNECLYAIVVPNMKLLNSTFTNCVTMDAFFTFGYWWTPQPANYGNVTVEGNRFGRSLFPDGTTTHYNGFVVAFTGNPSPGPLFGWKVRNNWFENDPRVDPADAGGNVFCGNTGVAPAAWRTAC